MSERPQVNGTIQLTATLNGKTVDMTPWLTQFGEALINPERDDGTSKAECRKP